MEATVTDVLVGGHRGEKLLKKKDGQIFALQKKPRKKESCNNSLRTCEWKMDGHDARFSCNLQ
jgi:hypothetical protein